MYKDKSNKEDKMVKLKSEIRTEKLRWVYMRSLAGDWFMLCNEEYDLIRCPSLKNLSKEEYELLDRAKIGYTSDSSSGTYIGTHPVDKSKILVTAPVFIEIEGGKFKEVGVHTDEWSNPYEVRRICQFIEDNIPTSKIWISGVYVDEIL